MKWAFPPELWSPVQFWWCRQPWCCAASHRRWCWRGLFLQTTECRWVNSELGTESGMAECCSPQTASLISLSREPSIRSALGSFLTFSHVGFPFFRVVEFWFGCVDEWFPFSDWFLSLQVSFLCLVAMFVMSSLSLLVICANFLH